MVSKFLLVRFRNLSFTGLIRRYKSGCAGKGIGVLGVPFGKGQIKLGAKLKGLECAPSAIRESNLFSNLKALGRNVVDYGDVTYENYDRTDSKTSNIHNYQEVVSNLKQVSDGVEKVLKEQQQCLVLGGDHSLFTGSVHGHMQVVGPENVAVVYIDAHGDINLNSTSSTGNFHGMCVAMVVQELQKRWTNVPEFDWIKHRFSLKNIGYIGLRCLDEPELEVLKEFNVTYYSMHDVVERGVSAITEELLNKIDPKNEKSLHVSIDTDSLDPAEAPSTTFPVQGGLLLRELKYIAEKLYRTERVRVVDWVELNPLLGSEEDAKKTMEAANIAILSCFGKDPALY